MDEGRDLASDQQIAGVRVPGKRRFVLLPPKDWRVFGHRLNRREKLGKWPSSEGHVRILKDLPDDK